MFKKTLAAATIVVVAFAGPIKAATYDLALSLLIDVSGSISTSEFELQMQGYHDAFSSTAVKDAIAAGTAGQIAVNAIFFSTTSVEKISFQTVTSGNADAFGDTLLGLSRTPPSSSATGIAGGISAAQGLLDAFVANNDVARSVIDLSGDGEENVAGSFGSVAADNAVSAASSAACGAGHTINAIAIQSLGLQTYYDNLAVCGGGFSLFASGFDTFGSALETKIFTEITDGDIPVPGSLPLLATGILAGGVMARRRKMKR